MLERVQADLVGLVGEASDLEEEILELRRKVSVVPKPEDMDALLCVKGLKRGSERETSQDLNGTLGPLLRRLKMLRRMFRM